MPSNAYKNKALFYEPFLLCSDWIIRIDILKLKDSIWIGHKEVVHRVTVAQMARRVRISWTLTAFVGLNPSSGSFEIVRAFVVTSSQNHWINIFFNIIEIFSFFYTHLGYSFNLLLFFFAKSQGAYHRLAVVYSKF